MCNNYHNRDEHAEAKKRIAEKLEIRVSDVETKMNGLRTYYSKELAKVRKLTVERSGMGTDELAPPSKWPHFQSMAFLRDSITPRKTISTINSSIDETDLEEVEDELLARQGHGI